MGAAGVPDRSLVRASAAAVDESRARRTIVNYFFSSIISTGLIFYEGTMSYQVIARRYRPQKFSEIIGQDHVTKALIHGIKSKRIGHAFLFCGPRGVGKTSCARILAKALNCEQGPTTDPCNECSNCKSITDGSNIDVIEIDAASNNGVDDVRQLREYIQLAPSGQSHYRIYIIDEVHMMSSGAFNALLKTLEEPPSHAIFILATTEKNKLPVTIVSRCQAFDFRNITVNDIVQQLGFILDNETDLKVIPDERDKVLSILARAGRGSMRDAESLFEQLISFSGGELTLEKTNALLGMLPGELISRWMDAILQNNAADALQRMSELLNQGIEFETLCHEFLDYVRSLAILKILSPDKSNLDLTPDEITRRIEQAKYFQTGQLVQMMNLCNRSIEQLRKMVPGRVVMDLLTLDCIQSKNTMPLDEIVRELRNLQEGIVSDIPAVPALSNIPVSPVTEAPVRKYVPVTKLVAETVVADLSDPEEEPSPSLVIANCDIPGLDWQAIVQAIRVDNLGIGMMLEDVITLKLEAQTLILGVSSQHELHIKRLEDPESKGIIEQHIQQVSGKSYRVKIEKLKEAVSKAKTAKVTTKTNGAASGSEELKYRNNPVIQKTIDLFGAAQINVRTVPHPTDGETQEEES